MSDDQITLEINGQPVTARKGQMIIEVTDARDVYVPRFCYHSKLSVAANCRMCLVEVEGAPKPLPACATPVGDGMKVKTRSPKAISAQRATMEFLLINHPLDCPICDQGGECELQDLAVGYGRDVARFTERKRVVPDKNLGPLVSTDMTRCIHCTRCVRFGQEIAGIQELGTTGRGEHMRITTYVERSVDHELSGNIIDLCPVGALNNKPYRFAARAWEMLQHRMVAGHDCIGSNIYAHTLRGTLKRVVPSPNEAVNETWIADRDRFSCEGVNSPERLALPMIREGDGWREADWPEALAAAARGLRDAVADGDGDALGILSSPSATLEECYLLQRLGQHLGTANLDHRLRMRDFRDQVADPVVPGLGLALAGVDDLEGVFVVGSNLRREVPLLAHRVRKAALKGARVSFLNGSRYEYFFPVARQLAVDPSAFVGELAAVVAAAAEEGTLPENVRKAVSGAQVQEAHRALAAELRQSERALILLGLIATRHPAWADIRALAGALAELTGATLGCLSEGANSAGACLAGLLPHRGLGGSVRETSGLSAFGMLESPRRAYLLNGVEPAGDTCEPALARKAMASADFVVALTAFDSPELRKISHVMLPAGTFFETGGTFVNLEGRWQSFEAAAHPVGESRAAWKILRVLGNQLGIDGFDYDSVAEIREEVAEKLEDREVSARYRAGPRISGEPQAPVELARLDVPMYQVDALVRRASALQLTKIAAESAESTRDVVNG